MKNLLRIIISVIPLAFFMTLSGCFTFNTMTTGRSLGKRINEIGLSTSSYYDEGEGMTAPILFRGNYTRGITQKWDLGGHISLGGTLGAHTKYQLVGDQESRFCLSPGLTFDYFGFSASDNSTDSFFRGYRMTSLTVPVHVSYHPGEKLAFYLTPKYVAIGLKVSGSSSASNERVGLLGITPGIEFGKKIVVGLEGNYLTPLEEGETFSSGFFVLSAGCRWRIGD